MHADQSVISNKIFLDVKHETIVGNNPGKNNFHLYPKLSDVNGKKILVLTLLFILLSSKIIDVRK